MAEQKKCKQCEEQFEVTDDDLVFLEKISPELSGKKYLIPAPKLCPECRQTRRYTWRNERHLYKRKCDKTGEPIVTVYSPDKPFKVYSNSAWKSDSWDPMSFGKDFDESRGFFDQFADLMKEVPRQANNSVFNENCDFCNQAWHSSNSYMSFNLGYGERCFYCNESFYVKDVIDSFDVRKCEFCYFVFDCDNCNNCAYLDHCKNCSESYFSFDCTGCHNVFLCSNQKNKEFMVRNKQLTKKEYEKEISRYNLGSRKIARELYAEFEKIKLEAIHKENNNSKSENCTGDYIIESKDCKDCYNLFKSENCVRVGNIDDAGRDSRDLSYAAEMELCYEGISISGTKNIFCFFIPYGNDNYYCNFCENCKNCFGCIGLKHKEYCILNKQFTKDEYEKKVAEIIEKMTQRNEWGEFFPSKMSVFAYNETVAQDYYSKAKEQAEEVGAYWLDKNYETEFSGEYYEPKDDIKEYADENEVKKLLSGVLKCELSGKPYKIMPQELVFYVKNNIPIPAIHYFERYKELFAKRNPRKLHKRQCMCEETSHDHSGRCPIEFETTYAPDRPERIYCESCYQKAVI